MAATRIRSGPIIAWSLAILVLLVAAAYFLRTDRINAEVSPYIAVATYQTEVIAHGGHPAVLAQRADGSNARIACSTCHATAPAATNRTRPPGIFHQGLRMAHGDLTCTSCHDAGSHYDQLRLADGRRLEFIDARQLCAQCHGPQARDYAAGAHGGMMGHWDLSRGPRQRQTCTACHDPHHPAYPVVHPAKGPNDRFLTPHDHQDIHHE